MSTTVKTTKYTYKSSSGGGTTGTTDVTMEYGTDIGAFTRLEVRLELSVFCVKKMFKKSVVKSDYLFSNKELCVTDEDSILNVSKMDNKELIIFIVPPKRIWKKIFRMVLNYHLVSRSKY